MEVKKDNSNAVDSILKYRPARSALLAAVLCCWGSIQAQLLYKISGNGLKKPSYIFGTNYTATITFVD